MINSKMSEVVKNGYKKIEDTTVNSYKKIENSVVSSYKKIEEKFVDKYLTHDGETLEDAKKRLKNEQEKFQNR